MPTPRPPEPILTWRDTRGYTLSDRIWNVSEVTAAQIDALFEDGFTSGTSSLKLAKQLEPFLKPRHQLPTTNKPYGTTASFNAMRLARSEITRSHSISTQVNALLNPFVDRMFYHLSAVHVPDAGDPCEEFADESERNGGYPVEECPLPMVDTHPHCICYTTQGVISEADFLDMIGSEQDDMLQDAEVYSSDSKVDLLNMAILGLALEYFRRLFE